MADQQIDLQTPDTVWICHNLYLKTPDALQPALAELRALGYTIKDLRSDEERKKYDDPSPEEMEKNGWSLWWAKLPDEVQAAKCGSCGAYISRMGIQQHDHRCEVCGAVTYLDIIDGSVVRFTFVNEERTFWEPYLEMKAHSWDYENSDLYLYPEPLQGRWGTVSGEKAQEYLAKHQGQWERVERDGQALVKVKHSRGPYVVDSDTISVSEVSQHYWNHTKVKLWQGQEYSEWARLPIPESFSIYEAWHWAPLQPSPTLHEHIINAAGMVARLDYYTRDGRAAFFPEAYPRMRLFVEHFTTLDIEAWERAERTWHYDYRVIEDIAHFCHDAPVIHDEPNFGNTLHALGKIVSGEGLTAEEVDAAQRGLADEKGNPFKHR